MSMQWKFETNTTAISGQLNDATRKTLELIGLYVEGEAKVRCPVGQYDDGRVGGRLRDSIENRIISDEEVQIGTPVHYSGYVEKGTSKMDAQPYLTPAVEENTSQIQAIVQQNFGGIGK